MPALTYGGCALRLMTLLLAHVGRKASAFANDLAELLCQLHKFYRMLLSLQDGLHNFHHTYTYIYIYISGGDIYIHQALTALWCTGSRGRRHRGG